MQRYHNLDFLRAFAMMMGVVLHAPIIFYYPSYAVRFGIENIDSVELWIWITVNFITNWRMPLFFLLSGFFTMLVVQRKGLTTFLKDRAIRIGVTCLLFSALYDRLDGSFDFTTGHLWFLYELMIFVLCFSVLYKIEFIKNLLCRTLTLNLFFAVILWLVLTAPLALVLNDQWHPLVLQASDTYFDLKLGNLVFYFSYFLAGSLLYSNRNIFTLLANNKTILALGFISVMAFLSRLYYGQFLFEGVLTEADSKISGENLADFQYDPFKVAISIFLKGVNATFWSLFFIGLATKFIQSGSAILRWFVEISYPTYLIQILPILVISTWLYKAGFDQVSVFFLTIITAFIVCVILYYIFIKFTPLNWLVNGYSKSFFKINFSKA